MKVKFLKGFQGTETRNVWYEAGKVADLEEEMAILVVRNGQAEFILDPEDFAALAVEAGEGESPLPVAVDHPPDEKAKPKGKGKRGGK